MNVVKQGRPVVNDGGRQSAGSVVRLCLRRLPDKRDTRSRATVADEQKVFTYVCTIMIIYLAGFLHNPVNLAGGARKAGTRSYRMYYSS